MQENKTPVKKEAPKPKKETKETKKDTKSTPQKKTKTKKEPEEGGSKKRKKEKEEEEVFKWWLAEPLPEGKKWRTLEHNGVLFPEPYKPHGVKMLYDGMPVRDSISNEPKENQSTLHRNKKRLQPSMLVIWKQIT